MLKNYIKIAWRNLMKNKVLSFINIFGLSIGLTCCILISLYIFNELSYDTHHKNGDRVYQLGSSSSISGKDERYATTSAPVGRAMQTEFPEIQDQARLMRLFSDDKTLIKYTDASGNSNSFYETRGYLADSSFFRIVTFFFKEGNAQTALIEPNTVVVSDELAQKMFGKESAINKVIRINSGTNGDTTFRITGVFQPSTTPSHIDAQFIMSFKGGRMNNMANVNPSMLNNNMFFTYFLLKEGADAKNLESKFTAFVDKHMGQELKASGRDRKHFITNIKDIHLNSNITKNVTASGSVTSLFILGSIAILTLLIACINFMNMSTSNSSRRASEVGVRKVLGALKGGLLRQFLSESLLMAGVALLVAIVLTILLLPLFEQVSGKTLIVSFEQHALIFIGFVLLAIITGFLAGSYPAFYLSSFKPIQVLKGKFNNSLAAVSLRKGMVVFQFVISIALIVASVVIANQMKYMREKDLGFVKDQQIILPLRSSTAKSASMAFRNEVAGMPGIKSAGASFYYPGTSNPTDWLLFKEGESKADAKQVHINFVDDKFLQTLDIKPVAGRVFSYNIASDSASGIILNEEAVKKYGFTSPEAAIGKWLGFEPGEELYRLYVVGVVKNFHFEDLSADIKPYAFLLNSGSRFNYIVAHAQPKNISNTLAALENAWKKLNPTEPFEYSFLEQDFQKNYEAESRQASLINSFTIIAIIISCLGLFALATFSAEQRTKEIGVRKVLGATVTNIVALISKDFLKLVGIAIVIACPIAWFAMDKWLQNFAFRVGISWQVFALTALLAIFVALFTISFQAIKAAISNPVKSLRTE
ncbi:MAG TPA: ABC transporter permease [Segetibacter sp.]|jgi:putative ABC transport system permease protein